MKLPIEDMKAAIKNRHGWAVNRLQEVVRCDTQLGAEQPGQECVAGIFEELGLKTEMQGIDVDKIRTKPGFSPIKWDYDGRTNVIGVHKPSENKGRTLVFNGHIDVVSPEPSSVWKNAPFDPIVYTDEEGEWMHGRGAGDMKGGSLCYMWALAALRDMGYEPASQVICQSVLEEECTGNGALAACEAGYLGDACIIPEPFNQTILRRQVGVMWFDVRVVGKTTHVLGAGRGVNAIEKSWVFIQAMRKLEEELNDPSRIPESYKENPHPINLNVGIIGGGDWASTVAGECVTRFRLGLFPGEKCEDLRSLIEKRVHEAAMADDWLKDFPPVVEYIGFQAEGYEFNTKSEFARELIAAHGEMSGGRLPEMLDATCTTDARIFELYYGVPCTCYGPLARNIHSADEVVSIDSMNRVVEVMLQFIERWCGIQKKGAV